jgi:hypothetical protein
MIQIHPANSFEYVKKLSKRLAKMMWERISDMRHITACLKMFRNRLLDFKAPTFRNFYSAHGTDPDKTTSHQTPERCPARFFGYMDSYIFHRNFTTETKADPG